jgi:hypothetical protein
VNGVDPLGLFCLGLCTFTNAGHDAVSGLDKVRHAGAAAANVDAAGVRKYDPFYSALEDYDAEYHAAQDGCSLSTIFGDASRAVGNVVVGSSILAVPQVGVTGDLLGEGANATVADLAGLHAGNAVDAVKLATLRSWSDDQVLSYAQDAGRNAMKVNSAGTLLNGVTRQAVLTERALNPATSIYWEDPVYIKGFSG